MTFSVDADASDDTAFAPRLPELIRCVGVSAPGGPPPLPVLRAEDSIFFSHLPMKPPPPTGLVNRSGSSLSSISSSSRSVNSWRLLASRNVRRRLLLGLFGRTRASGQHLGGADDAEFGWRIVDLPLAGRQAQRLCGRTAACGDVGGTQRGQHARQARRRWRLVHDDPRSPNSVWPSGNGGPTDARRRDRGCPRRSSMPVRRWPPGSPGRAPTVSMKTVWPSVHGGSPGSCSSTATGRPAKAVANMPKSCNRSASAPSVTGHLRHPSDQISVPE